MRKSIQEKNNKKLKTLKAIYTHTYILVLNNKIKKYIAKDRIMRKIKSSISLSFCAFKTFVQENYINKVLNLKTREGPLSEQ